MLLDTLDKVQEYIGFTMTYELFLKEVLNKILLQVGVQSDVLIPFNRVCVTIKGPYAYPFLSNDHILKTDKTSISLEFV